MFIPSFSTQLMTTVKHISKEVMPNLLNGELLALLKSKGITLVHGEEEATDRPFRTVEEFIKATSKIKNNEQGNTTDFAG